MFLTKDLPMIGAGLQTMVQQDAQERADALAQAKLEQQAAIDAMHFQGRQEMEQNLAAGMPYDEAFRRAAPKLYAGHEQALAGALHYTRPPQPVKPTPPRIVPFGDQLLQIDPFTGDQSVLATKPPKPTAAEKPLHIGQGAYTYDPDTKKLIPLEIPEGPMTKEKRLALRGKMATAAQNLAKLSDEEKKGEQGQILQNYLEEAKAMLAGPPPVPTMPVEGYDLNAGLNSLSPQRGEIPPMAGMAGLPEFGSTAKTLTADQARAFLKQAGGDRAKARKLARDEGYEF